MRVRCGSSATRHGPPGVCQRAAPRLRHARSIQCRTTLLGGAPLHLPPADGRGGGIAHAARPLAATGQLARGACGGGGHGGSGRARGQAAAANRESQAERQEPHAVAPALWRSRRRPRTSLARALEAVRLLHLHRRPGLGVGGSGSHASSSASMALDHPGDWTDHGHTREMAPRHPLPLAWHHCRRQPWSGVGPTPEAATGLAGSASRAERRAALPCLPRALRALGAPTRGQPARRPRHARSLCPPST